MQDSRLEQFPSVALRQITAGRQNVSPRPLTDSPQMCSVGCDVSCLGSYWEGGMAKRFGNCSVKQY